MELQRVNSSQIHNVNDLQETLQPGNITKGKIVKLYPNQKASIQLGNQTIVAQLEAPLSTLTSYYFQVQQSSSDVIHLKVLNESSQQTSPDNPRTLLQFLNLKASKARLSLLNTLIKDEIPFGKKQLTNAFHLLDMAPEKGNTLSVIKDMLIRKLPLTDATFQALLAHKDSSISVETREMMQTLREEPTTEKMQLLQDMFERLLVKPGNAQTLLTNKIISELNQEKPPLFNLLKIFDVIDVEMDLSRWKSLWRGKSHTVTGRLDNGTISLPSGMRDMPTILHQFRHANEYHTSILAGAEEILEEWNSKLHQALIHEKGLGASESAAFRNAVETKLMPHLTSEQSNMVRALLSKNNASTMTDLLNVVQTLSKQHSFQQVQQFLGMVKADQALFALSPKEQFLQQLNDMFMIGLLPDKQSGHQSNVHEQTQMMKSILIQLLHTSDGVIHDKANQLIHFLNGLHIQSVHETAHFLEATIQIPVEKLGLSGDMEVEISSHKNESGEINPDHCHILFYLDLAYIQDTTVDMRIQNRKVTLTILNDHYSTLKHNSVGLIDTLKKGLGELDYELQSVQFKSYHPKEEQELIKKTNVHSPSYQGVDYRI